MRRRRRARPTARIDPGPGHGSVGGFFAEEEGFFVQGHRLDAAGVGEICAAIGFDVEAGVAESFFDVRAVPSEVVVQAEEALALGGVGDGGVFESSRGGDGDLDYC